MNSLNAMHNKTYYWINVYNVYKTNIHAYKGCKIYMIICHPKIKSSFCPCKADQRHMYGQKKNYSVDCGGDYWMVTSTIYIQNKNYS